LGTQQQNAQSYNDNRTDLQPVRCIDTGVVYKCGGEVKRKLGICGSHVREVCKKKRKTAGGLRFEFV